MKLIFACLCQLFFKMAVTSTMLMTSGYCKEIIRGVYTGNIITLFSCDMYSHVKINIFMFLPEVMQSGSNVSNADDVTAVQKIYGLQKTSTIYFRLISIVMWKLIFPCLCQMFFNMDVMSTMLITS